MNHPAQDLLSGVRLAAAVAGASPCGSTTCSRPCSDRRAAARAAGTALEALTGTAAPVTLLHRPGAPAEAAGVAATLSVAHVSGRAVAAAASPGRHVGVDLEREGRVETPEVRRFAHASEQAAVADPTTLWALKEAAWKALQCARDVPFHALRIEFDAAGEVCAVVLRGVRRAARSRVWAPWCGWTAAVVEVAWT